MFYVQDGTATFRVGRDREEHEVAAGECIRFAPGEFQVGTNDSEDVVIGVALGAPKASHDFEEIESIVPCRECSEETAHGLDLTDTGIFRFVCEECGNEFEMGA